MIAEIRMECYTFATIIRDKHKAYALLYLFNVYHPADIYISV